MRREKGKKIIKKKNEKKIKEKKEFDIRVVNNQAKEEKNIRTKRLRALFSPSFQFPFRSQKRNIERERKALTLPE